MVHFSNTRSKPSARSRRALARAASRADARRSQILRAASRVFRTLGYDAAGMREIAAAADLSPANLYHYFSGKDEILYYCQDRTLDRLLEAVRDAARPRRPRRDRLRELAQAHVLCLVDHAEGSTTHFEVDSLPPRLRRAIVGKRDRYERAVRTLVAAGFRRGELAPMDVAVATRAFLGALNWTAQWFRADGALSAGAVAGMVADYAVAGLEKHRGTRQPRPDAGGAHGQRRASARRVRTVQDAARGAA